jgi:excisionase family DNA binding protein
MLETAADPTTAGPEHALAEGRRVAAAKRAQRRHRMARNMLEDQERRDWLESKLLRPGEVALLLQVSRRTVSDWARAGRLAFIVTPGGHRRFRARDVRRLVDAMTEPLMR